MFNFLKRRKYPEIAKYKKKDQINFRYRGELMFGYIYDAKLENGKIIYSIQTGGQCPAIIENFNEEEIIGLRKK